MARRTRTPHPRGREFAQAIQNILVANANKTYRVDRNNLETGAELARRLSVGSDFVSRVLAGERWPDLESVPEWAKVLEQNPVSLVLIWLHDRAPSVYEALYEEIYSRIGDRTALPTINPESTDLILRLRDIPTKPRQAVEALIEYLSAWPDQ